jgi:hypothetical protein
METFKIYIYFVIVLTGILSGFFPNESELSKAENSKVPVAGKSFIQKFSRLYYGSENSTANDSLKPKRKLEKLNSATNPVQNNAAITTFVKTLHSEMHPDASLQSLTYSEALIDGENIPDAREISTAAIFQDRIPL